MPFGTPGAPNIGGSGGLYFSPLWVFVLDSLSVSSAAAYSLRRLRAAYTGFAINVRRSSDNTAKDIGFVGGGLDIASMLTFCGAGNGFVAKWYDQSGNARDASQATAANQPQIVTSGVVNTQNNQPALRFNNGTTTYLDASTVSVTNPLSINAVAAQVTSAQYARMISGITDVYLIFGAGNNSNYAAIASAGTSWTSLVDNTPAFVLGTSPNVLTATFATGAGGVIPYHNGTIMDPRTADFGTGTTGIRIGTNSNQSWIGYIQDIIVLPSILGTTDRQTLEHNQESYYGIAGI